MRIRRAFGTVLLAFTTALTGCLSHTRSVPKTRLPDVVLNATLDQLLNQVDQRYSVVENVTLTVNVVASTGSSLQGKIKQYTSFTAYIVISQPQNLRFIGLVPLVHSEMLEMVSNGKSFKMSIPPRSCAIVGSDVAPATQKGLYSLRPAVILDSLLIPGLGADHVVSMTQSSRIVEAPRTVKGLITGKQIIRGKELIEEPDYDLEFLSQPQGTVARTLRVLHINRTNLLPYRQDIYNEDGRVQTESFYSNYQSFGGIKFPTTIVIQRPLDELGLTLTVTKAIFNQKLDPDAFVLNIPPKYAVQNMDDPVSAKSNPCVAHETPPQR